MKNTIRGLFLLVVLYFQFTHCHAQKKDDGLLATPYPGSIVETNPDVTDPFWKKLREARGRTYYSKDPMEKVMTHYTKLLGGKFEVSPEGAHIFTLHVVPFNEVYDIVTKRGGEIGEGGDSFWGGTMAGVTLHGKPTNNASHYSVTQVFDKLEKAYIARFQNTDNVDLTEVGKHLEDPELKKVEARYEHLKWSYYAKTAEVRKDGSAGNLTTDEVIFDKHYTAPEEARQKEIEQTQKKLTEASTSMKFGEAQKLGDRLMKLMQQQDDPKSNWDTAIKCFEEMDTHAYATMIVIDMHPSKWDLSSTQR